MKRHTSTHQVNARGALNRGNTEVVLIQVTEHRCG